MTEYEKNFQIGSDFSGMESNRYFFAGRPNKQ